MSDIGLTMSTAAVAALVPGREPGCPDDVGLAHPPAVERIPGGGIIGDTHKFVWDDGRRYEFWGYSSDRDGSRNGADPYYRCYWPGSCRQPAGWHGFRTLRNGVRDEIHYCARHMRVALGFSRP